jgi:hypothetical protein
MLAGLSGRPQLCVIAPAQDIHIMMRLQLASTIKPVIIVGFVLATCLVSGGVDAQATSPFARLSGNWSGSGTIDLSSGASEAIKCRAAYDVLDRQDNLQLNIRCASESYKFDLRGSAKYSGGAVTGTWSEDTRNAAGTISGTANGDHFEVTAKGPSFTASLTLTTRGNKQSVVIQSGEAQTTVKRASITLQRS